MTRKAPQKPLPARAAQVLAEVESALRKGKCLIAISRHVGSRIDTDCHLFDFPTADLGIVAEHVVATRPSACTPPAE